MILTRGTWFLGGHSHPAEEVRAAKWPNQSLKETHPRAFKIDDQENGSSLEVWPGPLRLDSMKHNLVRKNLREGRQREVTAFVGTNMGPGLTVYWDLTWIQTHPLGFLTAVFIEEAI